MKSCFTNNEIEELSEGMIRQFFGKVKEIPLRVNIERFIASYLRLNVEYHCFAEDYGKIGFISDGITPLCVLKGREKIKCVFPKGTVVLEKGLQTKNEERRRRFTLAHEAGHYIMDRTVSAASFHREYDNECAYSQQELRELLSFHEAQVDRLAAALLMPVFMVRNVLDRFSGTEKIAIYGDNILRLEDKLLVKKMSDTMGVSYTAFLIRLKELRLLEQHDVSEYITQEIGLGNGVFPL